MPKAKRYTEKRFVMLTPAQARQPELIRTAIRQHYGLPTESDRQPGLYDTKGRSQSR